MKEKEGISICIRSCVYFYLNHLPIWLFWSMNRKEIFLLIYVMRLTTSQVTYFPYQKKKQKECPNLMTNSSRCLIEIPCRLFTVWICSSSSNYSFILDCLRTANFLQFAASLGTIVVDPNPTIETSLDPVSTSHEKYDLYPT